MNIKERELGTEDIHHSCRTNGKKERELGTEDIHDQMEKVQEITKTTI